MRSFISMFLEIPNYLAEVKAAKSGPFSAIDAAWGDRQI
jgi:hypothetical protein